MMPTKLYGAADSISIDETLVYMLALSRPRTLDTALLSLCRRNTINKVTIMLRAIVMV